MNNVNTNVSINPFNDVYWKRILKVNVNSYGELRTKRFGVYFNEITFKKTNIKCAKINSSIPDVINQLLFIWSKDKKQKKANENSVGADNQMSLINSDTDKNDESKQSKVYGKDSIYRFEIKLEKTIHRKSMEKCGEIKRSLNATIIDLLNIWASDIKDAEISKFAINIANE